jgi:hypothetical protein
MGARKYLVGVLAFALLMWGPIDHSRPTGLAVRAIYLIAIPTTAWFALA